MFTPSFATPLSLILAFSCLLGSFSATAAPQDPTAVFAREAHGRTLPPAMIQQSGGSKRALSDIMGTVPADHRRLIHLWAPHCPPCHAEMRALDKAAPSLKARGVTVVAIAQDPDGKITVPAFALRHGLKTLDLYLDSTRTLQMTLSPQGLPVTYLVSAEGTILGEHLGALDWATLRDVQLE